MRAMLVALAAILLIAPESPASEVSVFSQSAAPGSSMPVALVFAPQASLVSGIQFDLEYDSSAMSVIPVVGDASRISGKSLICGDLAANKRRCLIVGLNQNAIPGGALLTLFTNFNPAAPNGEYPLALSNVVGTDDFGRSTPIGGINGTVTIEGSIDHRVRLQVAGVLNGGSLLPGPVAAGEVLTLIGSGIGPSTADPAGTNVLFDGIPAPILYASADQINAVVPSAAFRGATTQLELSKDLQTIAKFTMPVTSAVPAIFTLDSSGVGPGAIINQEDRTVNSPSNPLHRGSVATFFATGVGEVQPNLPVSVQIGGVEADVLEAGPTSVGSSDILRVTFRVPETVTRGYEAPIVLNFGAKRSQIGVTIAVQ